MTASGPGHMRGLYHALRLEAERLFGVRCVHDEGDPSQVVYIKNLLKDPDLNLVIYVANEDGMVELTVLLSDDDIQHTAPQDDEDEEYDLVLDLRLSTVISVYKVADIPESLDQAKAMAKGLAMVTHQRVSRFCTALLASAKPALAPQIGSNFPGMKVTTGFVREIARPTSPSYPGRGGDA